MDWGTVYCWHQCQQLLLHRFLAIMNLLSLTQATFTQDVFFQGNFRYQFCVWTVHKGWLITIKITLIVTLWMTPAKRVDNWKPDKRHYSVLEILQKNTFHKKLMSKLIMHPWSSYWFSGGVCVVMEKQTNT